MKREEKKGLPFFGIPKLAPYLKPYRMLFFWMVTMGGIGSAMDAVIPLFQQHAIDHFIAEKTMDGIGGFLALYILVMLVQTATNYISAYGACKVELYIGRDLKREAFNHLQTLSFSYFNQTASVTSTPASCRIPTASQARWPGDSWRACGTSRICCSPSS